VIGADGQTLLKKYYGKGVVYELDSANYGLGKLSSCINIVMNLRFP